MNRLMLVVVAALLLCLASPHALAQQRSVPEASGFDVPVSQNAAIVTGTVVTTVRNGVAGAGTQVARYRLTIGITPGSSNSVLELTVTGASGVKFDFDFTLPDGSQLTLTAGRVYELYFAGAAGNTYNLECETATRVTFTLERLE